MTMGSVDRERRLATWRNQKWSDDYPFSYYSAYHIGQALEMKLIVIYKVQHEIEAKIVSIATGAEFSVLLDNKGKVLWLDKHYYGPHVLQEFI